MNLKEYLDRYDIKKKGFCEKLGVTYNTLDRILKGHGVSAEIADRIIDLTEGVVTLKDLVSFQKKSKASPRNPKKNIE